MAFLYEQLVSVTGELRRRQSFFVGFTLLQKQEAKARKWENEGHESLRVNNQQPQGESAFSCFAT